LGAVLGWSLRGNCKKKFAKMKEDYSKHLNSLKEEKDKITLKAQQSTQLATENKRLLSRLSSMENGANLASNVLRENKAKLDEAKQSLSKMRQQLKQIDSNTHAETTSLLALKDEENQELRIELNDLLGKLASAEKQSVDDEVRIKEIADLYNNYVEDSRAFKLKIMQSSENLSISLKNKNIQCKNLKKDIQDAREEIEINTEHIKKLHSQHEKTTIEYENKLKAVLNDLQVSREMEIDNIDEIQIMQGLLDAHEKGNHDLSKKEDLLQTTLTYAEKLKEELVSSQEREKLITDEIEMIEALLEAYEKGNQELNLF
jgi:hypothetical protein